MEWYGENSALLDVVAGSAEVVAAILAVAITVVAIVIELAATRFSHRITMLFLKEPLNLWYLGLLVSTTLLCIWVGFANSVVVGYPALLVLTTIMISIALLLLLPYFAWVFSFISPLSVIRKFLNNATSAISKGNRSTIIEAIDELHEIARSAVNRQDRSIAMASVDALTELVIHHQAIKATKSPGWNTFDEELLSDPDFLSMESTALKSIEDQGLWLEVKVFRQFLALMPVSVPTCREVANLIGINTRKIAEIEDREALRELAMRCFNSYLRSTINARDPRSTYYLFHQYRLLGEKLLEQGDKNSLDQLVEYFQFYGLLGYQANQPFLLEVAAHDLMQLIRVSLKINSTHLEGLLNALVEMDQEYRTQSQEESLIGVRRAQIIAACVLADSDQQHWADVLIGDLKMEAPERLENIFVQLKKEHRAQFWEFTDRGANFAYLEPELQERLDEVIASVLNA